MIDFLLLLIILAILAAAGYYMMTYNRLQSLRNGADATLSQIRVAMKKRLDTIEQLVDSIESYAHFERQTLEKITGMRSGLESAGPRELANMEKESRGVSSNLRLVAESYPDLKTSQATINSMNAHPGAGG